MILARRSGKPSPQLVALFSAVVLALVCPAGSENPKTRILAGPNVLASRDGDFAHIEMMVAAHPYKDSELFAASIVFARLDSGVQTRLYSSRDGGFRWDEAPQFAASEGLGADPQVAYGPSGTMYFLFLNLMDGKRPPEMPFYRSTDGGRTWGTPALVGHDPYDHPQIVVDQTTGKYAGRVYLGVLGGGLQYVVSVFRSDDDGRSFVGPVPAAHGREKVGINVHNLMVLSDGSLVVPYCDFGLGDRKEHGDFPSSCWTVISNDGGVSFSAPRLVAKKNSTWDEMSLETFSQFAADTSSSQYKDRLYAIWKEYRNGRSKVVFSHSEDHGNTWSTPSLIDSTAPADARQYQPAIAVNKDGVVGVIWFDSRGLAEDDYNVFFTASEDGGKTFLPSVKLTDQVSHRKGAGNQRVAPATFKVEKETSGRLTLVSPGSRWGAGGDYIGLAADAKGVFHPLWPDSRSETFQIYTTRVKLEHPAPAGDPPNKCKPVNTDVTSDMTVVTDASKFKAEEREIELALRLKNDSKQVIYAPLTVQIEAFGSGMGEEWKQYSPTLLNASNGKPGDGAAFDYSGQLGSFDSLQPGEETGALLWKLHLSPSDHIPDLHYRIFGGHADPSCRTSP